MIQPWPLESEETLTELGFLKLRRNRARSPRTGQELDFYVLQTPDWVQVVPLAADGRLVLVRQYRHGSRAVGLEVPGGLLDAADPSPAHAAARELAEETGYAGGELLALGACWPQPALLSNRVHFFLARGVQPRREPALDHGEDLEVVLLAPGEAAKMAADGRMHNAMSIMALHLARAGGWL
ncbi:MAG: NUDIX hydrolase [Candidatus Lambdaproteobacteria bacterium]|nr:NUDIX hydrolase [Candidatus Lambdaproteobacteria bacterium]